MGSYHERIERKLRQAFAPSHINVTDDSHHHAGHSGAAADGGGETHFSVEIAAEAFSGRSRIESQRMIYAALAEELNERVHALSIRVLAPEE